MIRRSWDIRLLQTADEMVMLEDLQRDIWKGSETDVVPAHMLITIAHNGGVVLAAFDGERPIGFTYGFPGLDWTADGPRPKHCSHQAGVLPAYRDAGLGFALKRAQQQMVRKQGIDHITWTYDPLIARNAYLNIARLGAVCSTYRRAEYGEMRDNMNAGLPSDRFLVDWWVLTQRVERRLSTDARPQVQPADFKRLGVTMAYHSEVRTDGHPSAPDVPHEIAGKVLAAEIPAEFAGLKAADHGLAAAWRQYTRMFFEDAFSHGYIVTDFAREGGSLPRAFYLLTDGMATLGVDA